VGKISDSDGTVRVSTEVRREAKRRLDDVLGAEPTAASGETGFEAPATETDLPAGYAVGEYVIEEVLGRGGFGTVYRAVQPVIGKRVAIKVLSRKYSADGEIVSRFVAEARAVNQIRHRHIIDIFSFGQLPDGRQYYVMEYLEGKPLDQHLAENGPLELQSALPILRAIARALDAAHAKGVAHRDLKPENVFLARDDEGAPFPKLLDFGIAKLSNNEGALAHRTNTGVPIGTPYYMSPEQCRGKDVDHRTDIYSFGVLAYRLLTGAYPFDGALVDILHQQIHDEPPPPSSKNPALEAHIDAAILWMMRKNPAERPRSVIAAVVALHDDKTPMPAITPSTLRGVTPVRRRRWIVPAAALLAVAASAAVFAVMSRPPAEQPPAGEPSAAVAIQPAPPPSPASETPPAAPPATPTPPAAPGAAAGDVPAQVMVTVSGVPEGTEVLVAGKVVGTAPGEVQLARGDGKVVLTFRAEGYVAQSRTVVPSKDQQLTLALKKKPAAAATRTQPQEPGADDIIPVFGKDKEKPE